MSDYIDKIFDKQYIVIACKNNVILNSFDTVEECLTFIKNVSDSFNIPADRMFFRDRRHYVSK